MSKSETGKIHLIIGPMYAGKTKELLRLKDRAEIARKKCLAIKYYKDTRYDVMKLSTHDKIKASAIISEGNNLRKTIDKVVNLSDYDCIFVDEIQFYEDGAKTCDELANQGFEVIISGLQGDSNRRKFGCIPDLIPLAEKITHLTAIDPETGQEAAFTTRLSAETEQEVIGGIEKYLAVDRSHYLLLNS